MAKPLDPRLLELLKTWHPSPRDAIWDCHGTWVIYHKDVELIAAKAGVLFDMPVVLEANGQTKCAAICVQASLPDGSSTWSIGEAAPGNNKNAYPFAMAEKRARDRVVLKLLGLHGLYSEDEADDFKDHRPQPRQEDPAAAFVAKLKTDFLCFETPGELKAFWEQGAKLRERQGVVKGTEAYADLFEAFVTRGKALSQKQQEAA